MGNQPFIKFSKLLFWILLLTCVGVPILLSRGCSDRPPKLTASPHPKDGTAVYLLIDVSGSMNEKVPNAAGAQQQKLAIAKGAATAVCKSIAKYADEDRKRIIRLAVASFSDDFKVEVPMDEPHPEAAARAIDALNPRGSTAIGNAVIQAQQALDATGLSRQHIIILTDGENTSGTSPELVAEAINALPAELRPSVYVVAFDVNADVFSDVKAKSWQIFSASNGTQLQQQLDEVVGGHILLEK